MTVTLLPDPARPLAGKTVKLTFSASAGNYVKVLCTDAPADSKLRLALNATGSSRVPVTGLEGDAGKPLEFTPDKGGAYLFVAQELTKGAANYGGGYSNSPDAYPAETVLGETALTLQVGSRITGPIGVSPDLAELILYVWDGTIRETTEKVHGEATPRINVTGRSDRARAQALSTSVQLKLLALRNVLAVTAVGDAAAVASDLIFKFNNHIGAGGFHSASDTDNAINTTYMDPTTPEALKKSVAALVAVFTRHIENDAAGSGPGTGDYHEPGGDKAGDWAAKPIATSTGDLAQTIITLADLWRCYELHRVSAVHDTPDGTYALGPLPPIMDLHATFLGGLATLSQAAPATANSAVVTLVSGLGMREG